MKKNYSFKYRVIREYISENPNSTFFYKGEVLFIKHNHEGMPELKYWIKCVGENNNIGWIPREYIQSVKNNFSMTRDFNARELTVKQGEFIYSNYTLNGYCYAANCKNEFGWVPLNHLTILKNHY